MKVAIVHDYIKEYGGAERVLEELLKVYPKAEVYTSIYHPASLGPHRVRFERYRIKQSFFRYIPFAHRLISPLRVLSPLAFSMMDLSKYDIVIVSQTGAYLPHFVKTGDAKHISYTHTPPRYLYGYMTARKRGGSRVGRILFSVFAHVFRMLDFESAQRVDAFVVNSLEVKARVEKFYRREAKVIYPPVTLGDKDQVVRDRRGRDYYLAGGRLARAKGMDVIIDAFVANGKKLKVFGRGFAGYEKELESSIKGHESSIEMVGEVGEEEKGKLMREAKAYVFASHDEDFGITPVEAMGYGTPVVAYKSGGVSESVVDPSASFDDAKDKSSGKGGATGIFYSPNKPGALNLAITKFEKMKISPSDCMRQAERFSDDRFRREIEKFVETQMIK